MPLLVGRPRLVALEGQALDLPFWRDVVTGLPETLIEDGIVGVPGRLVSVSISVERGSNGTGALRACSIRRKTATRSRPGSGDPAGAGAGRCWGPFDTTKRKRNHFGSNPRPALVGRNRHPGGGPPRAGYRYLAATMS